MNTQAENFFGPLPGIFGTLLLPWKRLAGRSFAQGLLIKRFFKSNEEVDDGIYTKSHNHNTTQPKKAVIKNTRF